MHSDKLTGLYKGFNLRERVGLDNMTFKYVPNEDVIHRMNEVFAGDWSTEVVHKDVIEDQVLIEVKVSVVDSSTGHKFSHTGFGSQIIMKYKGGPNAGRVIDIGNAYKGALAKAIVHACTRWGVGLFKEDSGNEPAETPALPGTSAPVLPSVPQSNPEPASVVFPTPPDNTAHVAEVTAQFAGPIPPTGSPKKVAVELGITQTEPESVPSMPKIPTPVAEPVAPPVVDSSAPTPPTVPFTAPQTSEKKSELSDVQRVALNGILKLRNISYEDLAKEAFAEKGIDKPIPAKEDLNYDDAVIVIKYGNDKYRKV